MAGEAATPQQSIEAKATSERMEHHGSMEVVQREVAYVKNGGGLSPETLFAEQSPRHLQPARQYHGQCSVPAVETIVRG
jgi:hypothetical protein